MSSRKRREPHAELTLADALDQAEAALESRVRSEILATLRAEGTAGAALNALRHAMRAHIFPAPEGPISLRRVVDTLDSRTRREGLHVLHGWDYAAHRRPDDIAPVLLLDYCVRLGIPDDRPVIVSAGYLIERKGHHHVVRSLSEIRRNGSKP